MESRAFASGKSFLYSSGEFSESVLNAFDFLKPLDCNVGFNIFPIPDPERASRQAPGWFTIGNRGAWERPGVEAWERESVERRVRAGAWR